MTTLDARNLSLAEVYRLLNLERRFNNSFTSLLSLEPLTEDEQKKLEEIRNNFENYYSWGKFSEGQVKFLTLAPLMWLAGFYHPTIEITLEENIADISIEDEDTIIKGRMDILAVNKTESKKNTTLFWILVIEAKNSSVEALEGLPQLLTYAYKRLEHQQSVWGLTTNGLSYWFVYLQQGNPPIYQLLPQLNLIDSTRTIQLMQVLKAICKLQNAVS
jgi:hypothetical protein